jgi:hypothetical protein
MADFPSAGQPSSLYNHNTSSYHEITFTIQTGPTSPSTRKYKPWRTTDEKLDTILNKDADWLLSNFLFYLFGHENEKGEEFPWMDHQVKVIGQFLARNTKHSLVKITPLDFNQNETNSFRLKQSGKSSSTLVPLFTLSQQHLSKHNSLGPVLQKISIAWIWHLARQV